MNKLLIAYGLTKPQFAHLQAALPEEYELVIAACITDLIVRNAVCVVINAANMCQDALRVLLLYYIQMQGIETTFHIAEVAKEPLLGQRVGLGSALFRHFLDGFIFMRQSSVLEGRNVILHELEVHALIGFLGACRLVLLLFDRQRKGGMRRHFGSQFLVLRAEALSGLGKAGLGAGDGLLEEVDGETDGGIGRSSGVHGNVLSWLLAVAVGRNPYFFWRGFCFVYLSQSLHPDYTKEPIQYNRIGSEKKSLIFDWLFLLLATG